MGCATGDDLIHRGPFHERALGIAGYVVINGKDQSERFSRRYPCALFLGFVDHRAPLLGAATVESRN